MRLLSTKTKQLESFEDWNTVPPYAILSHTWEQGEVLFDDISKGLATTKQGWSKILGSCAEAEKLGIFHVWVDTCCIFKESSAELSESINSMFIWYQKARICFAYIGDLDENKDENIPILSTTTNELAKSRWWTRGWTLQELIAPKEVIFFDKNWRFIDFRSCLAEPISKITSIAVDILRDGNLDKLHSLSIAHKFSWAAKRKTTRAEDRAYSLMGLFGVSMSMIYGEGEQAAFYRLQKEIFEVYPDHSIFAWHYPLLEHQQTKQEQKTFDLLAPSVSAFSNSHDVIKEPYDWDKIGYPKHSKAKVTSSNKLFAEYSAISHGMLIQMLLQIDDGNRYIAYLACRHESSVGTVLGLKFELDPRTGQYLRVGCNQAMEYQSSGYGLMWATLKDVHVTAPRMNFVLSGTPVRYQMGSIISTNAPLQSFLTLEDRDAVKNFHFHAVDFDPPRINWGYLSSTAGLASSPGLQLQRVQGNRGSGAVVYKLDATEESFAIVVGVSQAFDFESLGNKTILATIEDNTDAVATAEDVLGRYTFDDNNLLLTDLSKQMLIKPLKSGKKVILSLNASREISNEIQKTGQVYQAFKLWVTVI